MKTGKAYAFLDYEGKEQELIEFMEVNKKEANFPDTLSFKVLDDKVSTMYDHKRKGLPAKIAQVAEATKVYCSVPLNTTRYSNAFRKLLNIQPVKASDLRYLVMAEALEVSDSEVEEVGQGMANRITAGMLNEVLLGIMVNGEIGASDVSRRATFYQDGRRNAQRYL